MQYRSFSSNPAQRILEVQDAGLIVKKNCVEIESEKYEVRSAQKIDHERCRHRNRRVDTGAADKMIRFLMTILLE